MWPYVYSCEVEVVHIIHTSRFVVFRLEASHCMESQRFFEYVVLVIVIIVNRFSDYGLARVARLRGVNLFSVLRLRVKLNRASSALFNITFF